MYQINCNKCTAATRGIKNRGGVSGNFLYFAQNFSLNLKLLRNVKSIIIFKNSTTVALVFMLHSVPKNIG